jgi:hypothetical protein
LVGALQEIKPLLEDHYKPNGSDIEEAFLLLLGMQGAIRLVNGPDSDSGRALAGLQGPALENFFSHFDEEFEKQLCGRVRKKLESLQRSNGEGRV